MDRWTARCTGLIAFVALLAASLLHGLAPAGATAGTGTVGQRSGVAPTSYQLLYGTDAEVARDLDAVAASGAGWIRVDFDWQSAEPSRGAFQWRFIDRVVAGANARGLRVLATPAYTPTWARPAGTSDKAPPTDLATYATFVSSAARRYAPQGVRHWEIWNEPNIPMFWQPKPDADTYARMLVQASQAVKAVDPGATIITAGLAPAGDSSDGSYVSPRTFLSRLYAAGGGPSFDAVGMHPYAFPYGISAVGDWNQFQSMPKTYEVMRANGDGAKKIWGTEFGAPTGTNSQAVSESGQAAMVTTGWGQWVAWPFTGPLFWYGLRDAGSDPANVENNYGIQRKDGSPKLALGEFTRVMRLADPGATVAAPVAPVVAAPAPAPAAPAAPAAAPAPVPPAASAREVTSSGAGRPSAPASERRGYWMVTRTGDVYAFGDARNYGSADVGRSSAVDLEPHPDGNGYWLVTDRGTVFSFGSAPHLGGGPGLNRDESVTSLSATPSGNGYWLFTSAGRVLPYGDASFFGDLGGKRLNAPVLDSVPTPSGRGYYLVAADGGIFTFGDAVFAGSTGNLRLNAPVQSLVPDPDGAGYWLVASDGGIFAFDAPFYGSMGGTRLNRPITGMVGAATGYLMVGEDGGIFTFAAAEFLGSTGANPPASPVTSVAVLA